MVKAVAACTTLVTAVAVGVSQAEAVMSSHAPASCVAGKGGIAVALKHDLRFRAVDISAARKRRIISQGNRARLHRINRKGLMSSYASDLEGLNWYVSLTCDTGACVGVARRGEVVYIRNTSDPDVPVSRFTAEEWRQFLAGAKLGYFDEIA